MGEILDNIEKNANPVKVSKKYKGNNPKSKEQLEQERLEKLKKSRTIANPEYYKGKGGVQAIDFIEAFTADLSGTEAICTANALECLCRWKKKDGLESVLKARWYINRLINHLEKSNK